MRTPFDSDESSWWATHGASSSKLPAAPAVDLEAQFEPTEFVSVEGVEVGAEPFEAETPEELAVRELVAAHERETVRDVALVRTAAALASEVSL